MDPLDEHQLYKSDRAAWARHVAPRRAEMLARESDPERKRALWDSFGRESQCAIRELRESK